MKLGHHDEASTLSQRRVQTTTTETAAAALEREKERERERERDSGQPRTPRTLSLSKKKRFQRFVLGKREKLGLPYASFSFIRISPLRFAGRSVPFLGAEHGLFQ